jgi:hypothetical protein
MNDTCGRKDVNEALHAGAAQYHHNILPPHREMRPEPVMRKGGLYSRRFYDLSMG